MISSIHGLSPEVKIILALIKEALLLNEGLIEYNSAHGPMKEKKRNISPVDKLTFCELSHSEI